MTSEGNSELLPANVDRRPPLQLGLMNFQVQNFRLYNKSLKDWSLGKQLILFPSNLNVFLGFASGNIAILGKQNETFASGPVNKCLIQKGLLMLFMLKNRTVFTA